MGTTIESPSDVHAMKRALRKAFSDGCEGWLNMYSAEERVRRFCMAHILTCQQFREWELDKPAIESPTR